MEQQEQKQEVQQIEQTSTETAEPSLEDVYKEFNVTPQAQPQAQPQEQAQYQAPQPRQPAEIAIPDPALDPKGHEIFMRNSVNESQQVKGALRAVAQHLQKYEHERAKAAEEADIKQAVERVSSKLKADPDFTEIAIAQRVRKDPKFAALWNNRAQNPQALAKGLDALSNELSKKFEFRIDPQLTENQRAMKEATQTKALGSPPDSLTDQLAKATGREFDSMIERIRTSGT